jgi:hypothetical protein
MIGDRDIGFGIGEVDFPVVDLRRSSGSVSILIPDDIINLVEAVVVFLS